jgi:hypothetical protein
VPERRSRARPAIASGRPVGKLANPSTARQTRGQRTEENDAGRSTYRRPVSLGGRVPPDPSRGHRPRQAPNRIRALAARTPPLFPDPGPRRRAASSRCARHWPAIRGRPAAVGRFPRRATSAPWRPQATTRRGIAPARTCGSSPERLRLAARPARLPTRPRCRAPSACRRLVERMALVAITWKREVLAAHRVVDPPLRLAGRCGRSGFPPASCFARPPAHHLKRRCAPACRPRGGAA